ncbi:MAG TPA: hypothetical protein VMR08_03985 [Patescibacteria group bacterium]|jgi:hypothetical protein|nr:hypothetical protein [Patescibacteria group bacterium]
MSNNVKKPITRWLGVISLIIFGALIGWDFSAFQSTVTAVIVSVIIAIVFVLVTKLANIEPGWPKD